MFFTLWVMHWASVIANAPFASLKNSRNLLVSSFTFQKILMRDGSLPSYDVTPSSSMWVEVSASMPKSNPYPAVDVSSAIYCNETWEINYIPN